MSSTPAVPSSSPPPSKDLEDEHLSGDEENRIPMADELDEDEEEILDEPTEQAASQCDSNLPHLGMSSGGPDSLTLLDSEDLTSEEQEEKARLIAQVLELQNTLDDLSSRVDNVKEENLRLRSENQVLGQYIENLMAASSVFQPANGEPSPGTGPGGRLGQGKKK